MRTALLLRIDSQSTTHVVKISPASLPKPGNWQMFCVRVAPIWRDHCELDPKRLAKLADMIEKAGCKEQAILQTLCGLASHVRGCWAFDLVLGRS